MPASFDTREEWLQAAAAALRNPMSELTGLALPERVRIGVGFPRQGQRSTVQGQCWSASASADGAPEITIRLTITEPVTALAVLLHELIHAADDNRSKHGGAFARAHRLVGFVGTATESEPSQALRGQLTTLAEALGEYPAATLDLDKGSGPKKQSTRMIKFECSCGFVFRTTEKWAQGRVCLDCPNPECSDIAERAQQDDSE